MPRPSGGRCCWRWWRSRTSSWRICQRWSAPGRPTVTRCVTPVNSPTCHRIAESEEPVTISPAAAAISARGVRKSFGEHLVLGGVDLTVAEGTIFALLGPNGAGKTTMVRILSTLIAADSGTARVAGHDVASDPDAVRRSIGVTGQFSAVDDLLTGAENLQLM